jgi:alpha-tubulin suppressor-like RCC1 family protein
VACWGKGSFGQLGNADNSDSSVPVAVDTSGVLAGRIVTQISAGANHTCALTSGSQVVCWGAGYYGQLGQGDMISLWPVAVDTSGVLAGKTVTQISAGEDHTCAVTNSGQVACWGKGSSGQLGNADNSDSSVPVAVDTSGVLAGKIVTQISAGTKHTCALTNDSRVACWGAGNYGQLGDGSTNNS